MRSVFSKLACALVASICLTGAATVHADDAKPAAKEQPASVGEVRTQTLKGFTYFYLSTRTKFPDLKQKVETMIPELQKGIADSHARVAGSLTFIYHGITEDPNAEFDMEIGFPIEEKVPANGNFKVRDVPDYKCMSVLFSGSFDQFSSAYEKLMPAAMAAPAEKTTESREMYLYFEETKSPNNVVHVSVGIK